MYDLTDVYCLAYGCPAGTRKKDCPFNELEKLCFSQRVKWLENMDGNIRRSILKHHIKCSMQRESNYKHKSHKNRH